MAATVAPVAGIAGQETPPGNYRRAFHVITFDASYPTGGYALTANQFGLTTLFLVDPNPSSAAHPVIWNTTTSKLQVFTAQGAEVANATDLHTFSALAEVVGL